METGESKLSDIDASMLNACALKDHDDAEMESNGDIVHDSVSNSDIPLDLHVYNLHVPKVEERNNYLPINYVMKVQS